MKRLLWPAVALLVALGLIVLVLRGCGAEPDGPLIEGRVDTVPDTIMVASRPKIVTRWRDRIIVKTVPSRVTVSQGYPDTVWAMRYAQAAIRADSLRRMRERGDSVSRGHAPILPPASGRYDGSTLTLWLTRSDGSLMRATAKLKPRWEFFAGTDGGTDTLPLFRSDRWFVRLVRETVKCAPPTGVMAGLGALVHTEDRVLGAVVAGGATLVGCLAG